MLFLVNPKKRRRRAGARASTRRRVRRSSKRRRAMPAALKAYWASKRGGRTVARKRKRRRSSGRRVRRNTVAAVNPKRRHGRRRYRRNPGVGRIGGGLVRQAFDGVKCGAAILAGEGISTTVAGFIPILGNSGIIGALKIGIIGTVLGGFGRRFLGSYTREFVGGAWAKAIKTAIPVGSIPLIGPGLAGYTPALIAPSSMSGYAPRTSGQGMSAAEDGSGYGF